MFRKMHEIIDFKGDSYQIEIEYPSTCPVCHIGIRPTFVYGHFDDSTNEVFTVLFSCDVCGGIFMTKYISEGYRFKYAFSVPDGFIGESFPERIKLLSPNFVETYNQSLRAEKLDLNEICGAGYRKSIEYLVKDFCSMLDFENSDAIWKENLGATINRIEDSRMRALSFAAKEIGNDQTHTVIKLSDGIPEMKEYIKALVSYIDFIGSSNIASNKFSHK